MTPKQQYQKFLQSKFWHDLRLKALERDDYKCVECGSEEKLRVHHKLYTENWFETKLEDLVTLCNECHRIEHGLWVHLPIDDIERRIKSALANDRRPDKQDWQDFKAIPDCEYKTEVLAGLMVHYAMNLRKPKEFFFGVRDSILSRLERYKHLAKNSEWRRNLAS